MAFKDRYGSTKIRDTKFDNLSIGWDYDDNESDVSQHYPVFLYIPHIEEQDHEHIALSDEQALILHEWLTEFIKHKGLKPLETWDREAAADKVHAILSKPLIK